VRSFTLVLFAKYYGNQIKEDVMGGACSTHGRSAHLKETYQLGDLGVYGRITLTWILIK